MVIGGHLAAGVDSRRDADARRAMSDVMDGRKYVTAGLSPELESLYRRLSLGDQLGEELVAPLVSDAVGFLFGPP
jgi:hypothetical protein